MDKSITTILTIFDKYKDIEEFKSDVTDRKNRLDAFREARKYQFISDLVGGQKKYEENLATIRSLELKLATLMEETEKGYSEEEIELNIKDIFLYTVTMNLVISFVNHFMGSNYGYLKALPKMFPFDFMPIQLFFILSVLISVIIIVTEKTYLYIRGVHHKNVEEDIII